MDDQYRVRRDDEDDEYWQQELEAAKDYGNEEIVKDLQEVEEESDKDS